jgi:hypothetical protein
MSQRPTGRFPPLQPSGPDLSYACRLKTSLQSTCVTTSASHPLEVCMDPWLTQGQISSEGMGLAPCRSGSTTIYFSGCPGCTCQPTMQSGQSGVGKSHHSEVVGERVVASGMGGRACQMEHRRSSMRSAACRSLTWQPPPCVQQVIKSLPMRMQTLTSYQLTLGSGGKPLSLSHLEKKFHTWASAGTCVHVWCTCWGRRRSGTWRLLRCGKENIRTTFSKHRSCTANSSTPRWSSLQDELTSQTWRPCSPPSTTIFSALTPLPTAPLMTSPGGRASLAGRTFQGPSQPPTTSQTAGHTRTPALALVWQSQLARSGARGGWQQGRSPREGTSSGLRPSVLNFSPSIYARFQARENTSQCMGTTGESSRDGGRAAVPISQPTSFSATFSSFRRIATDHYTQNTSQVPKTQQTPHLFFFFFFLNQFIFRNTSLRLGPVCIYEPIQFKRQGNIEAPTRRVNETETDRGADNGIRKRGAPVGRPDATRRSRGVQRALQP